MDQLRTDAIPFPFQLPFADVAEHGRIVLERVREEEWIRMMRACPGFIAFTAQVCEELRRRCPFADQAVRDLGDRHGRGFGQRPIDELPRGADSKRAGD